MNRKFYLTIKQGDQVFGKFNKFEFDLNTSKDIVKQADKVTSLILESFELPENSRDNISWKVFSSSDGNRFMMVSQSKNWME